MCRRDSWPRTGSSPESTLPASSGVSSTTRLRRESRPRTWAATIDQSGSTRAGSTGAMTSTIRCSRSVREAPSTRPTTRRSCRSRSTRSPAREASAASSRAASMAASRRGSSPMRAAAVRPASMTIITRRSRSGRQVRTTTVCRRAVARQSIERTSSPSTYSRRESNSVPCPRSCTAERPSISRSCASRLGRWRRERNGGSTRSRPGRSRLRCRAATPSGPRLRTARPGLSRSPRRVGHAAPVVTRRRSPAGTTSRCRVVVAPAEGCQASRTTARSRRRAGLATTTVGRRRLVLAHRAERLAGAAPAPAARRPGPGRTTTTSTTRPSPAEHRPPAGGEADRHHAGEREQHGASGDGHGSGSGRAGLSGGPGWRPGRESSTDSTDTPSSSASGRSCTRCRRVARAMALTSSGVT